MIALDQITKALVNGSIERGGSEDVVLGIRFVNVRNTGVAFSSLQGAGAAHRRSSSRSPSSRLLWYFSRHVGKPLIWLPTGMLLGGALGNVIDRIREGAVVDFIKVVDFWPAFNVADSAVTLGRPAAAVGHGARRCASTSRLSDEGERLDALLAGHLGSRTRAQRLIAAGQVLVDGDARAARATAPRRRGPRRRRAPTCVSRSALGDGPPAPHEVVWEDEHLLVVDKPAGVVVHPAAGHRGGTLVQALAGRAAGGDAMRPGVVHRLDRDTSGLLVVAKGDAVLRALQAALRRARSTASTSRWSRAARPR